jgi:hypothetical protein
MNAKTIDLNLLTELIDYHNLAIKSKKRKYSYPRYYLFYELQGIGTKAYIGSLFGLDHSSVSCGLKKYYEVKDLKDFKDTISKVKSDLELCRISKNYSFVKDICVEEVECMQMLEKLMNAKLLKQVA